ncbi:hypothetical protein KUTeg_012586 [Tegillarca granosa]|uniref:Uncharacterized protein n=1 Tax=Tegillarca granosa TaxID=220873 RepID=A0ABQ9F3H0_TEGGR|nr:hypothetical protein KUTeg_012586 [Tegillarca granosa]
MGALKKVSGSKVGPKSSKKIKNLSASSESDMDTDFVIDSGESEQSFRKTRTSCKQIQKPDIIVNSKPGPKSSKTNKSACKPGLKSSKPGLNVSKIGPNKPGPKSSKPGPKSSKYDSNSSKYDPNKRGLNSSKKKSNVSESSDTNMNIEDNDDYEAGFSSDKDFACQQETTQVQTRGRMFVRDSTGKFIKKKLTAKAIDEDDSSEKNSLSKNTPKICKSDVDKTDPGKSKAKTSNVPIGNERTSARLRGLPPEVMTREIIAQGQTTERDVAEKLPDKSKQLPKVISVSKAKTTLATFPKPRIILERSLPASEIRKLSPKKYPLNINSTVNIKENNMSANKTKVVERFVDPLDGKERQWEIEDDSGDEELYTDDDDDDDDDASDSDDFGVEQNNIIKYKSVNTVQDASHDSLLMDCETIKSETNIDGAKMEIDHDNDIEHSRNVLLNSTPEEIDIGDIPALVAKKNPTALKIKSEPLILEPITKTITSNNGDPVSTNKTNVSQSEITTTAVQSVITTKTTSAQMSLLTPSKISTSGTPVTKLTTVKREKEAGNELSTGHSGIVKIKQEPVEQESSLPSAPKRLKLVQVFSIPGVGSTSNTSMAQKHCPTVQVNKDPVIPGLKQQSLALTDSVTLDSKQATSVSQNLNDSVDLAIKEQSASKLVKDSFSCESKQSEQNSEIVKDLKYSEPIQTESAFQAVKDMKKLGSKSTPISEELVEDTTQLAPKQTTVVQKSKDPVTTALQKMNILKNNNIKSQNVSKNEILHRNSITESESSALLETAEGNNMDDKEVAPPGSLKKTGNLSQHDQRIRMSPLPSNLTKIINGELQMHFKRQEASSTVTVGTQANLELPSTSLQTTTSTVCSPTITACQSNSDIFIQGNNTQEKMRTVQQPQGNSQPQAATHSAYNKQAQQQQPITQTIVNTRMPFPQQVVSSVNATHPVTRPSVAVTVVATPTQQENKAPVYEAELLQVTF